MAFADAQTAALSLMDQARTAVAALVQDAAAVTTPVSTDPSAPVTATGPSQADYDALKALLASAQQHLADLQTAVAKMKSDEAIEAADMATLDAPIAGLTSVIGSTSVSETPVTPVVPVTPSV